MIKEISKTKEILDKLECKILDKQSDFDAIIKMNESLEKLRLYFIDKMYKTQIELKNK